eukprot:CAMPEP_0175924028 /NCGR_PEP_ID=MMETSP0108-20121206/14878_1 /TAXON_ID=195067 ORGANISM="Goniomonas pacifica, Strain CCMP1869" /NCGR_SAMPLE_ID=MMETSP0108 /ASSEMBLY_ACC=CAM_ASM_000204 /LENGTH=232 /DNA_ID=CAMNT_0017247053 /DNA_START=11 /DNA_END=706 /DNA_ORIENTATION=-
MPHNIQQLNIGGHHLSDFMMRMITEGGHTVTGNCDPADLKEKLCFTALDFDDSMQTAESTSSLEKSYELPDGKVITLNTERFRCPEALFQPYLLGMEAPGIHEALYNSIMRCDIDIRRELFGSVLMAGGTSMFPGIDDRLYKELISLSPGHTGVKVIAIPAADRLQSAWIGGSILASLSTAERLWVTKEDYEEMAHGWSTDGVSKETELFRALDRGLMHSCGQMRRLQIQAA